MCGDTVWAIGGGDAGGGDAVGGGSGGHGASSTGRASAGRAFRPTLLCGLGSSFGRHQATARV